MTGNLYLIRHGQAGTRNRYDTLSELGARQASLVGEALVRYGVRFEAAFSGTLDRQRQTALYAAEAYGALFPAVEACPEWNEFDLDQVYADVAPVLAARDPRFRAELEAMQAVMGDDGHAIHREWSRCDGEVLQAWVTGAVETRGESWRVFERRIAGALAGMLARPIQGDAAVFTSATPIGISCGEVLGVDGRMRFRLTGELLNSSFTVLRVEDGVASLAGFNHTPHLLDVNLRTYR